MVTNDLFKKRTADEWKAYLSEQWTGLRIYVQENGEKAAVFGFGLGILIVLFFKLFVFLVCMTALALLVVSVTADKQPK